MGTNIFRQFCIVLLQLCDLFDEGMILRLHAVILYQSHFPQSERCEKVYAEKNADRVKNFLPERRMGTPVNLHIISLTHDALSSGPGEPSRSWICVVCRGTHIEKQNHESVLRGRDSWLWIDVYPMAE